MWESWTIKKAEDWRTDVFRLWCWKKTLKSPSDRKEIKSVNPKGNQPWIFIERTDAKAQVLILWPPDAKTWLTEKDLDAGKDWRQEEKEATEDEMIGWHHWLNGQEFEQTQGASEGQGSLTYLCLWGCKESGKSEHQNTFLLCLEWHHLSSNLLVLFYFPFPI